MGFLGGPFSFRRLYDVVFSSQRNWVAKDVPNLVLLVQNPEV